MSQSEFTDGLTAFPDTPPLPPKSPLIELTLPDAGEPISISREEMRVIAKTMSIHDMPVEVKYWLAEQGIYTTTEPRHPQDILEFNRKLEAKRALDQLRDNAKKALRKYFPEYRHHDVRLGRELTAVFGAVEHVEMEGVHYVADDKQGKEKKPDKTPATSGTAVAERIKYTVRHKHEAEQLEKTFRALLQTGSVDHSYPVRSYLVDREKPDGPYIVEVENMDEYTNRVLGNAIEQLVAEDDFREYGKTILPREKKPFLHWKLIDEETFHPDIEARSMKIDDEYFTITGTYTIRGVKGTHNIVKYSDILGSDPAAVFQLVRDGFRPIIKQKRGGDELNKEQNPDINARLAIENSVKLTRDVAKSPAEIKHGPRPVRAPYTREEVRASIIKSAETKIQKAANITSWAIGFGIEQLLDPFVKHFPAIKDKIRQEKGDFAAWEEEMDEYEKSCSKTADLIVDFLFGSANQDNVVSATNQS